MVQQPGAGQIVISRENDRLYFNQHFKDNTVLREEVSERVYRGHRRFDPITRMNGGEHYIIWDDGYLEMHDDQGLVCRAMPIK